MKSKNVIPTARAYITFLEMCKIYVNGMRVVYSTNEDGIINTYNIPDLNTSVIILGSGCSITQQAMHYLHKSDVTVMFSGGGGFPLYFANMMYKPTEYIHTYMSKWYSDDYKLKAGKFLQSKRFDYIGEKWDINDEDKIAISKIKRDISEADNNQQLMGVEGNAVRRFVYPTIARINGIEWKGRNRDDINDPINQRINRANVIIYGMIATVLSTLGIPPAFAVTHGKTRRGGLVYDIADVYKDAIGLPLCVSSTDDHNSGAFKTALINELHSIKIEGYPLFNKMFYDTKEMVSL